MKWVAVLENDIVLDYHSVQYYFRKSDVEAYLVGLEDSLVNQYYKSTAVPFEDCIDFENWFDFEQFHKEYHDTFVCHLYLGWMSGKLTPYNYE
jgi:hypothetical protein